MSDSDITVGNKIITIEEPDGWKFLEATRLVGEITEAIPDLLDRNATFVREFQERTAESITRDEARLRYPDHELSRYDDEWWERQGNKLTIRGPAPGAPQQVMALFNQVYKVARDPTVRLLAVLSAPGGELAEADRSGNLEEYLKDWEVTLLHGVKLSKLVLLLVRVLRTMQSEFAADGEASAVVGEIRAFFGVTPPEPDTPTASEQPTSSSGQPETVSESETSTRSPIEERPSSDDGSTRPDSSSDSERRSDGTGTTPSTVPVGASSGSSEQSSESRS